MCMQPATVRPTGSTRWPNSPLNRPFRCKFSIEMHLGPLTTGHISGMSPSQTSANSSRQPTAPDVVADYVAAEYLWLEVQATGKRAEKAAEISAAREYVRAIDAYLVTLRASGRRVPYRLDDVSQTLRDSYGDAPVPQVA
jgi:hypothetical protein